MKKKLLLTIILSTLALANPKISTSYSYKDYDNSKTKIDGKSFDYNVKFKIENLDFEINYEDSATKRKNKITNSFIDTLNVEKLSIKNQFNINENLKSKISFLNIEDNLAPSDNGKIYSLGLTQNLNKTSFLKGDFYFSDYETFNVNQYDFSWIKKTKINDINLLFKSGIKYIDLNGNKYASYSFKEKDYQVLDLAIKGVYQKYYLSLKTIIGNRAFTVLNDGMKVQHHAMEQKSLYAIRFGKKFKNIDLYTAYNYQKGKELLENQDNVITKALSFGLSYKF